MILKCMDFIFIYLTVWHVRSQFPNQYSNPCNLKTENTLNWYILPLNKCPLDLNEIFKFFFVYACGCVGSLLLHGFFSSCGEQGLPCSSLVAVLRLLIMVASLLAEHRL